MATQTKEQKRRNKYIGGFLTISEHVNPEFLNHKIKKHPTFIIVEIHKNEKYGAIAHIFERNSSFDRISETTTKADKKRIHDSLSKLGDDKPVDTSKWVKPDEESIRNELICQLFKGVVLKKDSPSWKDTISKSEAFYSILHSHYPKNPQQLTNFSFGQHEDNQFEAIMQELKSPIIKKHYEEFFAWCDIGSPKRTEKDWNKRREDFQTWKKECIRNMVIPDNNPPKFKEICDKKCMKQLRKKIKEDTEKELKENIGKLKEEGVFGMSDEEFMKKIDSPGIKKFVELARKRFDIVKELQK